MEVTISADKKKAVGSYFWNTIYAGLSATQAAIILIFASRFLTLRDCGIITFGFTVANLMVVLANYGIRNFQVTDVTEKYCFSDYYYCRLVTIGCTVVVSCAFLLIMTFAGKYSPEKSIVIIEIIMMKMVDSFENVYVGRFQQKGYLNVGARISSFRLTLAIAAVCISIAVFECTWVAFLIGFLVSIVCDRILLKRAGEYADTSIAPIQESRIQIKSLLKIGVSLCIGVTLLNYIGNAPKYLVDFLMSDDEMQARIGYVMLPMFVITLLNNFIMQPTVKTLGDAWNGGDKEKFNKMIIRHISIISVLSAAVLAAGLWIGLPLIEMIYNVELMEFRDVFCMLFVGGTLYTLASYFAVLLTTVRRQKVIVVSCLSTILVFLLFGNYSIEKYGLSGLGMLYILADTILLLIMICGIPKKQHQIE